MSESLQAQWVEPEAPLHEHLELMQQGMEVVESTLVLPTDGRYQIAYALLCSGRGQKSSVLTIGEPASGKTKFGDMLFGIRDRVDIKPTDTDETLYGYTNPIDGNEIIPGKLVGLRQENPTAYVNELSQMANTGPVHPLWDAELVRVSGVEVLLRDVAIYGTSNFPKFDEVRVHKLDSALRSRAGIEMLTGDNSEETAKKIHGPRAAREDDNSRLPVLPIAAVRRGIYEQTAARYPAPRTEKTGAYIVSLLQTLNASGLVAPINISDARLSESLYEVTRAKMLWDGREAGSTIQNEHVAEVAALVLPKVTALSRVAVQKLTEEAGDRRPTPTEQAIAVRRIVASGAFATLFKLSTAPKKDEKAKMAGLVDQFSYANKDASGIDIDRALAPKTTAAKPQEPGNGRRSIFSRRSR